MNQKTLCGWADGKRVSPTRGGMNRVGGGEKYGEGGIPHASGDEPDFCKCEAMALAVYPTRVGMNRVDSSISDAFVVYTPREWG